MKILFVGLGSIGQRHMTNIKSLYGDTHELYALRTNNNNLLIQNGFASTVDNLSGHLGFNLISDIESALELQPDVVFITNPTNLHLPFAEKFASIGASLFIEKPFAMSFSQTKDFFNKYANENIFVAYQAIFDPCFKKIKEIVENEVLGKIVSARFEWGTYLPDHHPYENYLKSYASNDDMGGGVTRGLSHEIFMIVDLFGSPEKVYARFSDVKPLDLKSDETMMCILEFCKKQISFPVSLFLSYAQNKEMRDVKLQFEKGFVYCNFLENIVKVFEKGSNDAQVFDFSDIQRNDVFISEIKYFFEKITEKHSSINNLDKISIITKLIDELLKFKKE